MRWRTELVSYLATFVAFGGVLLWAMDAGLPVVVLFVVPTAILLLAAVWQAAHARAVLVVGEPDEEEVLRLEAALDATGYAIRTCAGPANRPCPVFQGRPCPIGERPLAALVYRAAGTRGRDAPCGSALGVPQVIVEERPDAEPVRVGRVARVGLDLGPRRVVRVMEELIAA